MTANRRFFLKLAVFVFPFAAAFLILTSAMLYTGESLPLAWVAHIQMNDPRVLYRPRYGSRDVQFKIISANLRQPHIVALGSSRILQFRAGFFDRAPAAFYNAAGPAWGLDEVFTVYESLNPPPKILLLAVDPTWFNPNYHPDPLPAPQSDLDHLFAANAAFMRDLLTGVSFDRPNFSMNQYIERRSGDDPALGLRAIRDGHAFRADGSEQYGDFLVAGWLNMNDAREIHRVWARDGVEMYTPADSLDSDALAKLDQLLDLAESRNTTVIGFMPSYAPSVLGLMLADARLNYAVIAVPSVLRGVFAEHGSAFFDFTDPASANTGEDEFFDGWHASERSNLRLYLHLLAALPDLLSPYSTLDTLRSLADSAPNVWQVFDSP